MLHSRNKNNQESVPAPSKKKTDFKSIYLCIASPSIRDSWKKDSNNHEILAQNNEQELQYHDGKY